MPEFGKLITFNEFIRTHSVEIPRIQRDYTYGSRTPKTERVVEKLLTDIHSALTEPNRKPLILDFVYGCQNSNADYEPLDGQQRLTTLFLLHLFAAWKAGKPVGDLCFRYATRDNTSAFCRAVTDKEQFSFDPKGGSCSAQIRDCSFFLSSFGDDPSISSMLAVLDKIEDKFSALAEMETNNLWDRLHDVDCKVKFYCLDFGSFSRFRLSNDLYIKMNSRGKMLTDYEIFKSQMEKYIEHAIGDKDLMYLFAKKFDTDFTDLVWHERLSDKSLIDSSFIQLLLNVFTVLNYKKGSVKTLEKKDFIGDFLEDGKGKFRDFINKKDVEFILDFMDTFHSVMTVMAGTDFSKGSANDRLWGKVLYSVKDPVIGEDMRIRTFKTDVNMFRSACEGSLNHAQILMLYAQYKLLKTFPVTDTHSESIEKWAQNVTPLRHIRNLIEASDNELRPEHMRQMLSDIDTVISSGIGDMSSSEFNATQFAEEKEKAARPDRWKLLYRQENHDILRGSLSLFCGDKAFSLKDDTLFALITTRLNTFEHIFDDSARQKDRSVRAALLSVNDFSQVSRTDIKYKRDSRMIGTQFGSWREMFRKSEAFPINRLMETLDMIDPAAPLAISPLSTADWRYYATQKDYYMHTYVSYTGADFGYVHFVDFANAPLEVYLLQSTQCYDDNVMWKMLNRVLWGKLWQTKWSEGERQRSGIGNRKLDSAINVCHQYKIDAVQKGWQLTIEDGDSLVSALQNKGYSLDGEIVLVPAGEDYIEFALNLTDDIKGILDDVDPDEPTLY